MAEKLKVKALSAAITVSVLDDSGKPRLRVSGVDAAGKPVVDQVTQIVFLDRGAELPDHLAKGEVARLKDLDAVGPAGEVDAYIRRITDPMAAADADRAAADARLDLVRGTSPTLAVADRSDAGLAEWIRDEKPTVAEVVAVAGDNPTLARRLIAAESEATGGDPRTTLVEELERVASAGASE